MEENTAQDKIIQLQEELDKTRSELCVLYEISNAMRTSLKLDDVLYIILTGVTAHAGLGFNRAMLFLINEKASLIEGKMGIGPHTGEEANLIWKQIEAEKNTLDDLIENYKASDKMADSQFNHLVTSLKFPLDERNGGVVALSILENMPIHISREIIPQYVSDHLLQKIHMEEFAIVPLKTKDKVIGTIVVDNIFNKKPITKDDMRILTMFANQAGLAIENSQLYEQTVLQAQTDSLTKLWNHGYFQYCLQEEVKEAKQNDSCVSLILLDMDNFKELNDALGHQAGDQVLKDLAQIIKDYCRKLDYPCRYGGEEFAVILPQANKKEAYLIAERIRQAIEKYHFYNKETGEKKISVSIGVATLPENSINDKTTLLSFADKALYEAKQGGKNKTCLSNG
ncbi:MAG: sensor domain-containing diguanylate cyclase [Candidatus Omnitrophota bacterium]|nr:sensor domain-containing diguanylate cyclase [Candidatus Omnitrophota bacterium]